MVRAGVLWAGAAVAGFPPVQGLTQGHLHDASTVGSLTLWTELGYGHHGPELHLPN